MYSGRVFSPFLTLICILFLFAFVLLSMLNMDVLSVYVCMKVTFSLDSMYIVLCDVFMLLIYDACHGGNFCFTRASYAKPIYVLNTADRMCIYTFFENMILYVTA